MVKRTRALLGLFIVIGAVLIPLVAASSAMAETTLTVTTNADTEGGGCTPSATDCSLREELELVESGGVSGAVKIKLAFNGTIALEEHGSLDIDPPAGVTSLAIEGSDDEQVFIDGMHRVGVFYMEQGDVRISGVTIAHGLAEEGGGAIYQNEGELSLEEVTLLENEAEEGSDGGAVYQDDGSLTIAFSKLTGNVATGLVLLHGHGGAIYEDTGAAETLTIESSELTGNFAEYGGGAIYQDEGGLDVSASIVSGNEVGEGKGGGINLDADAAATSLIEGTEISRNKAIAGGAGGGVMINDGTEPTLREVWIDGNEAGNGGGLYSQAATTVERSTISDNVSDVGFQGGGLLLEDGELALVDSTVTGNGGPGLSAIGTTPIHVRGSTIAGNFAPSVAGAGIQGAKLFVVSSIVAENQGLSDCQGEVTSEGHNLVGVLNTGGSPCVWNTATGDQFEVDPMLGGFRNNGGATPTLAPISRESPAINHGSDPTATDQRGRARPVPAGDANTDVGAVEIQAPENEVAPAISPTTELGPGDELTCNPGTWETDAIEDPSVTYEWLEGSTQVGSEATYELQESDAGKELHCRVTVDDGAAAASAESNAIELIPATASLSPTSLSFGNVVVGQQSAAQTLTLTNTGDISLTVEAVVSSNPTEFPVEDGDCTGGPLNPAEACEIEVSFDPAAMGASSASLTVHSDAGEPTATLDGTGILAIFSVTPTSHDFGSVPVGEAGGTQTFTVGNVGTAPLEIGAVAIAGTDPASFELVEGEDQCSGATLAPTTTCTVEVGFEPQAAGVLSAEIEFTGTDPERVPVHGTGTAAELEAAPASIDFGSVDVGSGPAPQTVTLVNSGDAAATLGETELEGPGSGQFEIAADGCKGQVLAAEGGSCELSLRYLASAPGSAEAEVRVTPGSGNAVAVGLAGTAVAAPGPAPAAAVLELKHGALVPGPTGAIDATVGCTSTTVASCEMTLTLDGGGFKLGSWSGTVAVGSPQRVSIQLSTAAKRLLGSKGTLTTVASLSVAGGTGASTQVRLLAPPAPVLNVGGVRLAGSSLVLAASCKSTSRCQGRIVVNAAGRTIAHGPFKVKNGRGSVRLKLAGAGKRLLAGAASPKLLVVATTLDPAYHRSTTREAQLRLAGGG
jgi:hypothetical protein